jgi:hypothetical protein
MHKRKPYIIICDEERGTLIIIYAEISGGINVIKKEATMILKYKKPAEIQQVWNVKTQVIPVITEATGTLSKSFIKYLISILGKHNIKEVQKKLYWAQSTYFKKY